VVAPPVKLGLIWKTQEKEVDRVTVVPGQSARCPLLFRFYGVSLGMDDTTKWEIREIVSALWNVTSSIIIVRQEFERRF